MAGEGTDLSTGNRIAIGETVVRGIDVDTETRCDHFASDRDVVAIQFPCCDVYYPCYRCHQILADHESDRWPRDRFDERAVLCGSCGTTLRIDQYLVSDHTCPVCAIEFNPGCADHYHLYFEGDPEE